MARASDESFHIIVIKEQNVGFIEQNLAHEPIRVLVKPSQCVP